MNKVIYEIKDRILYEVKWRFWFWVADWIRAAEALLGVCSFTFINPCWWTKYMMWRAEKD